MIRLLDIVLALAGLVITAPALLLIYCVIQRQGGSPLFIQERLGRNKRTFNLVKFRTMAVGTASVATHLAPADSVTALGRVLRRTKLDELPQLLNVLKGEMSLVGPRPCLIGQAEVIDARDALGVFDSRPGITGAAQVSNIDMSTPDLLAQTDARMLSKLSLAYYLKLILLTVAGNGAADRISNSAGDPLKES